MEKQIHNIVVTITPFDDKGNLDEAAFRRHLGRLRDAGVSVFLGSSSSGEGYSFTPEERERVIAIGVEELKGKVPSVRAMGCEPRVTKEMIEFVRAAEKYKPDAIQVFSVDLGHGSKPTTGEIERYYSTVIETTSSPVILSSHARSGYLLPLDVIERVLNRFPNIIGLNCGTTDVTYLSEFIRRFKDRVEVHCAGATNALIVLGLGGHGFMGTEGNLLPKLTASIINSFKAGDHKKAGEAFTRLMQFAYVNDHIGGGSVLRLMKPLLNAFGLPAGTLRPPRLPVSQSDFDSALDAILKMNLEELPVVKSRTVKA